VKVDFSSLNRSGALGFDIAPELGLMRARNNGYDAANSGRQ
jgi:hypothetical protein